MKSRSPANSPESERVIWAMDSLSFSTLILWELLVRLEMGTPAERLTAIS